MYEGAFEGWYRGAVHAHAAGGLKLKEPGDLHRRGRVTEPYTLQGALLPPELVAQAAAALGLHGPVHFPAWRGWARTRPRRPGPSPCTPPSRARRRRRSRRGPSSPRRSPRSSSRAPSTARPTRCARRRGRCAARYDFLGDALTFKVTLDALAEHAGLDKFHLVRAFRAEVGLPPYEYLTHLRVARAKSLLARGAVAAEVAHAVGLYDESQLHRHFRRIVGLTPGRFARSLGGPGPSFRPTSPKPRGRRRRPSFRA